MNWKLSQFYGAVRDAFIAQIEDDMLLHGLRSGHAPQLHMPMLMGAALVGATEEGT